MIKLYVDELKGKLHPNFFSILRKNINELRPVQEKAVKHGLLETKNLLVCSPTASGKTLIAEIALMQSILNNIGKAVYIVPLKALATEKYKELNKKYGHLIRIAVSIGDLDSDDSYLTKYDLIITTSEKLDSLIRHNATFLRDVFCVVVDEIHLMNDLNRGPTLELVIIILKRILKKYQLVGLSATIGNEEELANWLNAELIHDDWRPVKLYEGILVGEELEFFKEN